MKRYLFLSAAIILLVAAGLFWAHRQAPVRTVHLDHLVLYSLTGAPLANVTATRSPVKATLYMFWSPDCGPCIREMPQLERLYQAYRDQGLQVIGVMMYYGDPHEAQALQNRLQLHFPLVWDREGQLAQALGRVNVTPTLLLFNAENTWAYGALGAVSESVLSHQIQSALSP